VVRPQLVTRVTPAAPAAVKGGVKQ
jgi:hypothetical protein